MEQLKLHLSRAYNQVSRLQVSGDAVDVMAVARAELREAWKRVLELEETKSEVKTYGSSDDPAGEREAEDPAGAV